MRAMIAVMVGAGLRLAETLALEPRACIALGTAFGYLALWTSARVGGTIRVERRLDLVGVISVVCAIPVAAFLLTVATL